MFYDRIDAGEKLADKLFEFKNAKDTLVFGLARGGVVVAKVVAEKLNLPLDILIAKKITAPDDPELAIGAIAENGHPILNDELIGSHGVTPDYLDQNISQVKEEIDSEIKKYRHRDLKNFTDKTIILVDDGIATGKTMLAAIKYLKENNVGKIIIAVPVIAKESSEQLKKEAVTSFYFNIPETFFSINQFYEEFPQVTDEEILKLIS